MKHLKGTWYCHTSKGENVYICTGCGTALTDRTFNSSNSCKSANKVLTERDIR